MILSMTGYGKGEVNYGQKMVTVDIRSLNGKIQDIRIKTPLALGNKELDLRKLVQDDAIRGKIDLTIELHGSPLAEAGISDGSAVLAYHKALKEIFSEAAVSDDAIFQAVIRIPNVLQSSNGNIAEDDWKAIAEATTIALSNLREYRETEGTTLYNDLVGRIKEIQALLELVDAEEEARQFAFRDRLTQKLAELRQEGLDENRLEQEMLYYLDKIDVNEEKVRLRQHCDYFLQAMDEDEIVKGKKLNFISQEIGREMNTLGAKAQWTSIQHNVVGMKNALEEIKEQLANAL
jgi:uncharacterized protein (TIGR00255 family)